VEGKIAPKTDAKETCPEGSKTNSLAQKDTLEHRATPQFGYPKNGRFDLEPIQQSFIASI
jgi:transposase